MLASALHSLLFTFNVTIVQLRMPSRICHVHFKRSKPSAPMDFISTLCTNLLVGSIRTGREIGVVSNHRGLIRSVASTSPVRHSTTVRPIACLARQSNPTETSPWVTAERRTEKDRRGKRAVKVKDYVFLTRCHELTYSICVESDFAKRTHSDTLQFCFWKENCTKPEDRDTFQGNQTWYVAGWRSQWDRQAQRRK